MRHLVSAEYYNSGNDVQGGTLTTVVRMLNTSGLFRRTMAQGDEIIAGEIVRVVLGKPPAAGCAVVLKTVMPRVRNNTTDFWTADV